MGPYRHPTRRKTWVAYFRWRGRRYKREGFSTKADAAQWEGEARKVLKAQAKSAPSPSSFYVISARHLVDCEARFQPKTWKYKATVYRSFLGFLGGNPPIDEIPKQAISGYLARRRDAAGNIAANRDLVELRSLWNWAIRNEIALKNPTQGIVRYPQTPKLRYIPPAEAIDKVLLAANPEEMDLLLVLYHTAARIGEILRLSWEDVNFEAGWVRLWTRKRRGGELHEDYLPLGVTLRAVLDRRWKAREKESPHVFPEFRRMGRTAFFLTMPRLCDRAGVKPFGFHAIRHHVASRLQDSGKATTTQIQKFLRHKKRTTTEIYLHMLERGLEEMAEILDEGKSVAVKRGAFAKNVAQDRHAPVSSDP